VPAFLALGAGAAYNASILSTTFTGFLWIVAVAWIGIGYFINGWSCGRVHCRIDGILLPLLAIIGALNILSVITISWTIFWLAFIAILVASFVPEMTWKRYS
jgi:hypothetical protein